MNNRIKEVRETIKTDKGKKYTQTQFAEALHVTRDMIATYESGRVEPTALFISQLCTTFNVNEVWLRSGEGDMFKPLDREEEVALIAKRILKDEYDNTFAKIVKNLAQLNEDELEAFYKVLKTLTQ